MIFQRHRGMLVVSKHEFELALLARPTADRSQDCSVSAAILRIPRHAPAGCRHQTICSADWCGLYPQPARSSTIDGR
jgi:hypothetical protein